MGTSWTRKKVLEGGIANFRKHGLDISGNMWSRLKLRPSLTLIEKHFKSWNKFKQVCNRPSNSKLMGGNKIQILPDFCKGIVVKKYTGLPDHIKKEMADFKKDQILD